MRAADVLASALLLACGSSDKGVIASANPPSADGGTGASGKVTLSVGVNGQGGLKSTPAAIDCGNVCTGSFDIGARVQLTAAPADGMMLAGWSGACSGAGTCTLTMSSDLEATARFEPKAPPATSYSVLELPGPVAGAADMSPTGINGRGDVVGVYKVFSVDLNPRAFLYDAASGSSREISAGSTYPYVSAINDARQVSLSTNDQMLTRERAFRWQDGSMIDIGALRTDSGQPSASANAINAVGHVAGSSLGAHGNLRAVLWDGSTLRDLGSLSADGSSQANGVNASDVAVGWSTVGTETHAAVFQDGRVKDLGALEGRWSKATAISDSGRVVGNSVVPPISTHAFVYDLPDGPMRDITPPGRICLLRSVNSAGDAVGTCTQPDARADAARASLWRDGTWIDLNDMVRDSSWTLHEAAGINDRGQIAGIGEHDHQVRAFLLTPR